VQHVLEHGYAPDLNDVEIEEIGKDPFLIAAALAGPDRAVVTPFAYLRGSGCNPSVADSKWVA